jgi:hypothetical protein
MSKIPEEGLQDWEKILVDLLVETVLSEDRQQHREGIVTDTRSGNFTEFMRCPIVLSRAVAQVLNSVFIQRREVINAAQIRLTPRLARPKPKFEI